MFSQFANERLLKPNLGYLDFAKCLIAVDCFVYQNIFL